MPLAPLPDEALWLARCRDGVAGAFEPLAAHYREWLTRNAALLLGDEQEAEDVAQEALVLAMAHMRSFEGRSAFSTWLCGIAVNLCRKQLRRRSRHARQAAPELLDRNPARSGAQRGVLSSILRREDAARLEAAIARLPLPLREAFLLRVAGGMDYPEVAEAAGISEGTARVRVYRARALLQQEYAGDWPL